MSGRSIGDGQETAFVPQGWSMINRGGFINGGRFIGPGRLAFPCVVIRGALSTGEVLRMGAFVRAYE